MCLRTGWRTTVRSISRLFQSVERICVPSNEGFARRRADQAVVFQSVERICVPSNHWPYSKTRASSSMFQSVERICVPSNPARALKSSPKSCTFQSVERICVPSNALGSRPARQSALVSIRRTDLCAFEPSAAGTTRGNLQMFQSVERICVPSNFDLALPIHFAHQFQSVERICVPSNCIPALEAIQRSGVSIRRTDLCAFEPSGRRWPGTRAVGFNPSNGFVCLRTWTPARATCK